jgi:hypothetical protein
MTNFWKDCGRKRSRTLLRCYPGTCFEGLREALQNLRQHIPVSRLGFEPENEAGMLSYRPRCSVNIFNIFLLSQPWSQILVFVPVLVQFFFNTNWYVCVVSWDIPKAGTAASIRYPPFSMVSEINEASQSTLRSVCAQCVEQGRSDFYQSCISLREMGCRVFSSSRIRENVLLLPVQRNKIQFQLTLETLGLSPCIFLQKYNIFVCDITSFQFLLLVYLI